MTQNNIRRVAILGGNRIPFARSNGAYFKATNIDMLTAALNGLVNRFGLYSAYKSDIRPVCRIQ